MEIKTPIKTIRNCHRCPDCKLHTLKRHRVEVKQEKFITYEYRCECGARFVGSETIDLRRAFGDSDSSDDSIPLAPKLKNVMQRMVEQRFLHTN